MNRSRSVSETLKRLRESNPTALADNKPNEGMFNGIPEGDVAPSEFRKLSEEIKRRRLTGDGISKDAAKNLLRRIGK